MNHLVAPSILAADFGKLSEEINMINQSDADYLHVDVMDGLFVPNISFGQSITATMAKLSDKPLDVHLMIEKPERYVDSFVDCGAQILSVHLEASTHLHRTLQAIKAHGIKAGVAINPHSSIEQLLDTLDLIDVVVIMSVNPGFGGQKFIYRTLDKIKRLKKHIIDRNLDTKIEIDGGVGLQNVESILRAGADILVAGSSVFKSDDPINTISRLKSIDIHTVSL